MITPIKKILQKKGLYYPLKYSRLFHVYELLFKPAAIKQQRRELAFYKSFLPSCKLIFDIGAYDGHKAGAFLAIAEKVVCCEPDSQSFKILQVRFRHKKKKALLVNKALSNKEGSTELNIHHPGSAFNTLSGKWMKLLEENAGKHWNERIKFTQQQPVQTTTLDRLINDYGVPDFIKIDTEGSEQEVLEGLSCRVRYLSFEILLPEYAGELERCLAHIKYLDDTAIYNICLFEKMVFPEFVSQDELKRRLGNYNILNFDVVVKMSV